MSHIHFVPAYMRLRDQIFDLLKTNSQAILNERIKSTRVHFWLPWPVPSKDWGLTSVSACVTVSAYLWTLVIDDLSLSLGPGNQTRHVLAHYQPGPDWDKNWGLNVDCVLCWHKLLLAAALSTRPPPHQPGRSDSWFIRMMVSRLSGSLSRECTAAAACTNTIHPTEGWLFVNSYVTYLLCTHNWH